MASQSALQHRGYDQDHSFSSTSFSNPFAHQRPPHNSAGKSSYSSTKRSNDSIRPSVRFAQPVESDDGSPQRDYVLRQSRDIALNRNVVAPHRPVPARSSKSDYISCPKASPSDYIASSEARLHLDRANHFSRQTYGSGTAEIEDYVSPWDKSDWRMIKEGGWSCKKDFMECHGLNVDRPGDFKEASHLLDDYRRLDAQYASPRPRATSSRGQLEYYECDEDCINNAGDDGWIGSSRNEEQEEYSYEDDRRDEDVTYFGDKRRARSNRIAYEPRRGRWDDGIAELGGSDSDTIDGNNQHGSYDRYEDRNDRYPHDSFSRSRGDSQARSRDRYDTGYSRRGDRFPDRGFVNVMHYDSIETRDTGFAGGAAARFSAEILDNTDSSDDQCETGYTGWTDGGFVNTRYDDQPDVRSDDGFVGRGFNDGGYSDGRSDDGGYDDMYGDGGYDDDGWDECGDFDDY